MHLPRDVAEMLVHPVFREFTQRFISVPISGIHAHTLSPLTGILWGSRPPGRAGSGRGGLVPRPKLYPGLLRQSLHHGSLWVLLWMVMMRPAVMHHHPMYQA